MGAVLILTPLVISAWPAFVTAVTSAAASLGYSAARGPAENDSLEKVPIRSGIAIEVPNSEVLTDQLGLAEKLSFTREGISITLSRDERGKASVHVHGAGHSEDTLRRLGEEMSQRLVRDYVYRQIRSEMELRDFVLVEEVEDETHAIHMTVRHWEH